LLRKIQIPAQLKVQPEVRGHAKIFGQAQSGAWGDAAPAIDDVVDLESL
jgi:hypothetical protein